MVEERSLDKARKRKFANLAFDFWLLMKPELTLLSVFTGLGSAFLAIQTPDEAQLITFPLLAIGTLFVGGGSGALNQFFEWREDAIMKRTQKRPIPDERITPHESLIFALVISSIGVMTLYTINWLAALLSLLTLVTYVFLYTPLKKITSISTIIGAVPGALPTLIGWAAIRNSLSIESVTLFAILFYWQMPHFYSIGWLYRNDYISAGFKILTGTDHSGRKVSRYVLFNQFVLLWVALSPSLVGLVSWEYAPISFVVSALFLFFGAKFRNSLGTEKVGESARLLFFSSLFYLPIIFSAMIIWKVHE